ncbi:MAG: insulinase family protein [Clostridia bacterium]|nr:insulinase family protein [Clostridia bacterium]
MYIYKQLKNGIRVYAEDVPYAESVSLGVWVGNGSRHETAKENGMSHFIEHMVFKGTETKSAKDIALLMDSVGGHLNAFTTRECTCFYAKTLSEHTEVGMDILSDMVFCPKLSDEDMELERRVVFEEIAMYEDSPEDVVYDLFSEAVWGNTPMGRTILGTPETLSNITPDSMRQYMNRHYTSKSIVIAVAGKIEDSLFDGLEKYFGERKLSDELVTCEPAFYKPKNVCRNHDFEQVQLVAGFNGIDIYDERVYSLLVFNNVFGSGMSSRLFQNIREKYGLVYSIGAGHSAYADTGTFDILAATTPENVEKVAELTEAEIKRIKSEPLTNGEIERAKVQLKGNYILSGEGISSRMQAIGRAALLDRPLRSREEILDKINSVNRESIAEIIETVLDEKTLSIAAAGPINSIDGLFLGL